MSLNLCSKISIIQILFGVVIRPNYFTSFDLKINNSRSMNNQYFSFMLQEYMLKCSLCYSDTQYINVQYLLINIHKYNKCTQLTWKHIVSVRESVSYILYSKNCTNCTQKLTHVHYSTLWLWGSLSMLYRFTYQRN